ncbi:hydantoinase/oxoprolinase family protein [Halorientalis sp.]|uniref:hydantoinase/oxoprolinase family protein n=1 Tax=Halorientalis sp. TaxID=1931229 RepID=UPI0026097B82|nr:hydantoinase/oxoprolinase family protein [Halorientalis sp.]
MSYQMACDIGGTFTDLYVVQKNGDGDSFKSPTTPDQLLNGLFNTFEKAAASYGMSSEELLKNTNRLVHGTTIATNAIVEDKTSKTALICTDGFRETLLLREGGKNNPYDWSVDYPDPYVPRSLTFGVDERVNSEGNVVDSLDENDVIDAIGEIKSQDVEAVAVSLLWGHVNPIHERRIAELFEEHAPGIHCSLSHEINPIIREYRRTSTTAINASVYNLLNDYLSTLGSRLNEAGFSGEPLLITANGGTIQLDEAVRRPVWLVDAGPTMLPVAGTEIVNAEIDETDVISLDMGGTSLDMNVATEGIIPRTREAEVGDDILGIEKVDVRSIGSGGGSIAWVDEGGLLHIGPESAGADPGPVCYRRGGERPTVTDAALVLGYLDQEYFLGGDMTLDYEGAVAAIEEHVADELDIDPIDAARSIYATTVQDIANGIQGVTIEQGIDPRNYVISGGGGALGTFAVPIARQLQIDQVLLPRDAGVATSIGGLISDISRDFSMSEFTTQSDFDFESVNETLSSLEQKAEDFFDRIDADNDNRDLSFYAEARYPQQVWELQIQLPESRIDRNQLEVLTERFDERHQDVYGFSTSEDIEFLYWRVEATSRPDIAVEDIISGSSSSNEEPTETVAEREAYFDGARVQSPVYRSAELTSSDSISGPAFVDGSNTTIVLPPKSALTITEFGNYLIEV